MTAPDVPDVLRRIHGRTKARRAALDELGIVDVYEFARVVETTTDVRDLWVAYAGETRPQPEACLPETLGRLYSLRALLDLDTIDVRSVRAVLDDAIRALGGRAA